MTNLALQIRPKERVPLTLHYDEVKHTKGDIHYVTLILSQAIVFHATIPDKRYVINDIVRRVQYYQLETLDQLGIDVMKVSVFWKVMRKIVKIDEFINDKFIAVDHDNKIITGWFHVRVDNRGIVILN